MSDKKHDKFFEAVIPASIIIANLKLMLVENFTQKIIAMLKEENIRLTKENLDDIGKTTLEIVSQIEPSFFNIPLGWEPKSDSDMKKKLDTYDQKVASKIVDEILNRLKKKDQSSLSEYFK
ncbi:MAG: hypothetical protein HY222_00710 [Thaumarchaeota archaeon]|nr:hypothetical protein [Nitrososphaerota archaeon]MBI3640906.1 hypothetical protein [Nitrososphaerota archaeon]